MGIMVYSLLWVMQDLYHQRYLSTLSPMPQALHPEPCTQTPGKIEKVDPRIRDPILRKGLSPGFWAHTTLRVHVPKYDINVLALK